MSKSETKTSRLKVNSRAAAFLTGKCYKTPLTKFLHRPKVNKAASLYSLTSIKNKKKSRRLSKCSLWDGWAI